MRVIPVSDASDGPLVDRFYSYWPNAWVHPQSGDIWVFAGHQDGRPRFFRVDPFTDAVERMNWFLPYRGTTEGWYWAPTGELYLLDGPRLRRVDIFTGRDQVVFDISDTHPGCDLWQAHSSDDGETHSATVREIVEYGPYPYIGTVVFRRGQQAFFDAHGRLDESQITPDGAFLIIKEDDDNRVITLDTRETRLLRDADGAVGHSDTGPGIVVGEDNHRGALVWWDLRLPLVPERKRVLLETWNLGHVSHGAGRWLRSSEGRLSLVALDGSGETPLLEHGGGIANLSPCGKVATYMVNGSVRLLVLP
jgi:hypothetical protein